MSSIDNVVYAPVLTEKANHMRERHNQFVFKVAPTAGKQSIKEALEKLYGVKIEKVAIVNVKGKPKRTRKFRTVYTAGWKKAIVKLKPGKTFEFYEGV